MTDLDTARERRKTLFPAGSFCEDCEEHDPLVLIPDIRNVLCGDCRAIRDGLAPIEKHHIAGKRYSSLVVPVSVNMHRRLTALQRLWLPKMRNVHLDVRLYVAFLRGCRDLCHARADDIEAAERA
jgi:hypothetical protein